jgi:SAM-dependent methyltransferase
MTDATAEGYVFNHAWAQERTRLRGLEVAFDPGTRGHLARLGVGPGRRCLEVGAGSGSVACWLAERVAPDGEVVACDTETGFLRTQTEGRPCLRVLRHDIASEDLAVGGFDVVCARWVVHWLPDKRLALRRMAAAVRPGGVLLVEEPDFVTAFYASDPLAVGRVVLAGMRYMEATTPINTEYGRRLPEDLNAAGLAEVEAEGRCPLVRGGSPPAGDFLRLTLEKLRAPLLAGGDVNEAEFGEAVAALQDPAVTVVMPMTVAAWGRRA